ncbi:DUF4200 domain-containing protein [Burkholderia stagnalis]|uniref:DUF4200 domain-containing protein n=1 Tax=Burkholderia stagnalis TaxID=1503054 RepID=UPI000B20F2E2|nr:DUF4200 domain-containing protein [Burkholderia stagnalis]
MKTIYPRNGHFTYQIDEKSFSAQATAGSDPSIISALDKLTWDKIFDDAIEGASSALVKTGLSILFGPTPWESKVSGQLQTIIGRLDDILDEIRALRTYIRDEQRKQYRDALHAQLTTHIATLTSYMAGIRQERKLEGNLKYLFLDAVESLTDGIGYIANHNESETNRPIGIPLFAAVESGLVMLIVCQRILDLPTSTTKKLIADYTKIFKIWGDSLINDCQPIISAINSESTYLCDFPHRGALEAGGVGGSTIRSAIQPTESICYAVIDGGLDKPFVLIRVEAEEYPKSESHLPTSRFPFPYSYTGGPNIFGETTWIVGGLTGTADRATRMVQDLNNRRNDLLENLEQLRKVQLMIDSIASAPARLARLLKHEV